MPFINNDSTDPVAALAQRPGRSEVSCSSLESGDEILAKTCAIAISKSLLMGGSIALDSTWREKANLTWVTASVAERALELLVERDLAVFEVDGDGVIQLRPHEQE